MSNNPTPGLLIVFEGTDGTGKSTQIELLLNYLHNQGFPVISTREPTEGTYGHEIRQLYINREKYSHEEELELFLADRREHVADLLEPALAKGNIVLCDRYFLSTAAYQGAIGFDSEAVLALNNFAPDPDIAFVFHMPVEISLHRITSSRGDILNDFEQTESLQKVAEIFASIDRDYIQRIDATASIDSVHQTIINHVTNLLHKTHFSPMDKT